MKAVRCHLITRGDSVCIDMPDKEGTFMEGNDECAEGWKIVPDAVIYSMLHRRSCRESPELVLVTSRIMPFQTTRSARAWRGDSRKPRLSRVIDPRQHTHRSEVLAHTP